MSISKAALSAVIILLALIAIASNFVLQKADHSVLMAMPALPNLSAKIPGDVRQSATTTDIDKFSWQSFVGVNWPADGIGVIGAKGDNVAVWQFWKQDTDVLVPAGQTPIAWKTPSPVPAICTQKSPLGTRILTHSTKRGELGTFKTPGNGPLIDQNGKYVRFEILLNETMYDFILQNNLYSKIGQASYNPGGDVAFPLGVENGAVGAVMLKIAWKIMGAGDDPTKFHTSQAYIFDPGATPKCDLKLVGLVGMHISHKTTNAPQWVWSTFEHVDNAPLAGNTLSPHYNFNDAMPANNPPNCGASGGTCNLVPSGTWDPNTGVKTPVQVVRLSDVTSTAKAENTNFTAALKAVNAKSVFANYNLIGTQFPTDITSASDPSGVPRPLFLANSTMETYLQGKAPRVSSDCAGCHVLATMSDQRTSDFSFILARVGMH